MTHIGKNYRTIPKSLLLVVRGEGTFPVLLGHINMAIPVQIAAVWLLGLKRNHIYLTAKQLHLYH